MIETLVFAALTITLAGLWWWAEVRDGAAWRPVDVAAAPARALRWAVAGWLWRRRVEPYSAAELRRWRAELDGERRWALHFAGRRQQLQTARHLRLAGYHLPGGPLGQLP